MKLSKIHISDYNQFKDFSLDLTYPKGHPKEGKPLDKICIIGQSGTGKSTLLQFIYTGFKQNLAEQNGFNLSTVIKSILSNHKDELKIIGRVKEPSDALCVFKNASNKSRVIFFHLFTPFVEISKRAVDKLEGKLNDKTLKALELVNVNSIVLQKQIPTKYWQDFTVSIRKHNEELTKKQVAISRKIGLLDTEELEKENNKLKDWLNSNSNPIKVFSDKCNSILAHFNTVIKNDFEFEEYEDLKYLVLETLNGDRVEIKNWSTGTSQLIEKLLPLHILELSEDVILIDEPENSLYPNIQRQIVDFYQTMAPEAQFIYATHSPLIASSFEPWEIVELKFNKEGKVFREEYYEGENHVDNYTIFPQYLDYQSILTKVFDIENDSSDERMREIQKFATLKDEIKKMSIKKNGREALEEKINELTDLGKKLNISTRLYEEAK